MGRRSGITVGGYHPQIFTMHLVMAQREILADNVERAMNKKKMRSMYWNQRLANAMGLLRVSDPSGWEAWFDNDANVPADANDQQMSYLVEARVRALIGHYPTLKARACRGFSSGANGDLHGVVVRDAADQVEAEVKAREQKIDDDARLNHRPLRWPKEMKVLRDSAAEEAMAGARGLGKLDQLSAENDAHISRARGRFVKIAALLSRAGSPIRIEEL